MGSKYKVIIWGTGGIGKACLKQALQLDAIEVVGVKVYSPKKTECDIAELVGMPPVGLNATTDKEALLKLDVDCILYSPMDHGDFRTDDELTELLSRGFNIITSASYQNINVRGEEVKKAFQEACAKGGSTFYATGVNPGFVVERLAMTATGACSQIKRIQVEEFVKIGTEPQETLNAFGFGLVPSEDPKEKTFAAQIAENYERQFIYYLGDVFGSPVKYLDYTANWKVADEDFQAPTMVVKKDTAAFVTHRWDGKNDEGPEIVFMCHWYMSDKFRPADVPCDDYYLITIEGTPSLRLGVEMMASIDDYERFYEGEAIVPTFYVTGAAMLQAIPSIIASPPGIKAIEPPSNAYWKVEM